MEKLELIEPCLEYAEQVMNYKEAMLANHDSLDGCAGLQDVKNYTDWINFEERLSAKYGDSYVPSYVYLAIRKEDNKLVGIADFRNGLTNFLLQYGGNIGYSVLPEERRKGYAKEILKLVLKECRKMGVEKVLLTCDKENIASNKVIQYNGGKLENEVADEVGFTKSGTIKRYWIEL